MIRETTQERFIFEAGQVPFKSCHASNLARLADGRLACVWFAGTAEGESDVGIWQSIHDGFRWGKPTLAAKDGDLAHWNPVLFQYGGNLLLFYKVGMQIPEWRTHVKDLNTGEMREIDDRGPVRTKICIASDGTMLAGASTENGPWISYCDISKDDGQTWERSAPIRLQGTDEPRRGLIQPSIWESEMGVYHMLTRSTEGFLYRSDSRDGLSWTEPEKTEIPNNNSGFDLVNLGLGHLILCSNPVSGNWAARTPLTLAESFDNGKTFKEILVLEDQPGEYSYPSLIFAEGKLYVSYTWNREKICCREFEVGA